MVNFADLPVEMIEKIFQAMLTNRRRDNCAEDFLHAINLVRTCRIMRDIGLRVLFPGEPRLKRTERHRRRLPPLQLRYFNRADMTSEELCTELRNLESRCISRLIPFDIFERHIIRAYRSITRKYRHAPEDVTFEALQAEADRLAVVSGRDVYGQAFIFAMALLPFDPSDFYIV